MNKFDYDSLSDEDKAKAWGIYDEFAEAWKQTVGKKRSRTGRHAKMSGSKGMPRMVRCGTWTMAEWERRRKEAPRQ